MSIDWMAVADVLASACMIGGAFLAFAAGVGVLRFPDLLSRMHAGTKPQVLGLVLVLIGLALRLGPGPEVGALVLVVLFQMITAPVAAHMVGRAGYRTGKVRKDLLVVDELTLDQARADSAEPQNVAPPVPDNQQRPEQGARPDANRWNDPDTDGKPGFD